MNLRTLSTALMAGMAIAILLFLLRMTQTVDNDLHLERLRNIRAVDALDVQLNRAVTQSGAAEMTNMNDLRSKTTAALGTALDDIDKGPEKLRGLSSELDQSLDAFLDTIQDKVELGFDFEARTILLNQRLISGIDAVPILSEQLEAAADANTRDRVRELTNQIKAEITTLGVLQSVPNPAAVKTALDELGAISQAQSETFRQAAAGLRGSVEGVIADKSELVDRVGGYLSRPTGPKLGEMEKAYMQWHSGEVEVANRYRTILAAYAALLLAGVFFFVLRLRIKNQQLDRAYVKLSEANENLEGQVHERTKDLSKALKHVQEQETQLIQSEKMASLGQMIAGVAHEINTPLAYARSNARMVRSSLEELQAVISLQDRALSVLTAEEMTEEEAAMALGEAAAKRDEVNPVELAGDLDILLNDAGHGLTQIAELVASLKDFSRVDRSRHDFFNVNHGLDSALKIAHNQIKDHIEVVKDFGEVPEVECAPSQINQVFLNLITNAGQAIEGNGKITLHTRREGEGVRIRLIDTGSGMSDEVKAKIFEPFFTTKPVGQGTGLGLSIVFRIIEDHGGKIDVISAPGQGTEFSIYLPLRQTKKAGEMPPIEVQIAKLATG